MGCNMNFSFELQVFLFLFGVDEFALPESIVDFVVGGA